MTKRLLHSVAICALALYLIIFMFSCSVDDNVAEYWLEGSWESTNAEDRFSSTTSNVSSTGRTASVIGNVVVTTTSLEENLPYAIIVRYDEGAVKSQKLTESIKNYGREISRVIKPGFDFSRIEIHTDARSSLANIISYYESLPGVTYVEEDHQVSSRSTVPVDDEFFILQWNFKQLGMDEAWNIVEGDDSVIVAIIDTGISENISDLIGTSFTNGWNFVGNDDDTYDDNGHGTHVSGTVAQTTNNGYGTAGMAYGVTLMPIKVLNSNGEGYSSDIAAGIIKAADLGADIINLSLSGDQFNQTTYDALEYAYDVKGVTIFAASGNDCSATVGYPAAYEEFVIAVGATTRGGEKASYSNYGPQLDIVAPGGDMTVTQSDGILQQSVFNGLEAFYYLEGTSMATPHAAALGALLLSRNPELSPAEIYTAITETAVDLGTVGVDDYHGYGLISPAAALLSVPDGYPTYAVSDLIHVEYIDSELTQARWYFNADSGEIHLTLASSSSALALALYDPHGVQIIGSEEFSGQEIIHQIDGNGGEFSVMVQ